MPKLDRDGDVYLLDLGDDENRFNIDWVSSLEARLDEVQAAPAPRALVTMATGKFWSNGLDLEWMAANPELIEVFIPCVHDLLARVLGMGVATVAALQGHTFAAGAMLALAHDERVMRADRGFFCLPEADIGIPFTPGMTALIAARLSSRAAHDAMITGRRYGGGDAVAAGIVDEAVDFEQVLPRAIERAGALAGKDPTTMATIKQRLYVNAIAALRDREANALVVPG
jgi:enoyl-CoA hydratase/carnithine racemase